MLATEAHIPSPISQNVRSRFLTIGSQTSIIGPIQFDGNIQLKGTVRGEIRCISLTVSECGSVDGVIVADAVVVAGRVDGSIYANSIALRSTCEVEGEITHSELNLEPGCYFEGKSRRFDNPIQMAPAKVQD